MVVLKVNPPNFRSRHIYALINILRIGFLMILCDLVDEIEQSRVGSNGT